MEGGIVKVLIGFGGKEGDASQDINEVTQDAPWYEPVQPTQRNLLAQSDQPQVEQTNSSYQQRQAEEMQPIRYSPGVPRVHELRESCVPQPKFECAHNKSFATKYVYVYARNRPAPTAAAHTSNDAPASSLASSDADPGSVSCVRSAFCRIHLV